MAKPSAIARKPPPSTLCVVMKAPRGVRGKLQQDSGVFALASVTAARSTFGWAAVPKTLAEDGDALDAVVIDAGHTVPGEPVTGDVVGGLMVQLVERDQHRPERDERLVLVLSVAHEAQALSAQLREQVQSFVVAAGEAAGKRVLIEGWEDASYVADAILRAGAAFQRQRA
jgi:inorganic pyrophosphatase